MKENLAIKIIIPFMIICIIAGIWAAKTFPSRSSGDGNTVDYAADNSDFALDVSGTLNLSELKSYNLPIIVEFGADWCAPCRQMYPIIEGLNKDLKGKAIIKFVDIDKYQNIASQYDFQYIPTQLFIDANGDAYNPANAAAKQMDLHKDPSTGRLLYTTHTGTLTKEELLSILTEMGMK